ncbi:MAG TPA: TerC family protein [Alphaproteobacteria bacterium]|nr:TerC family protein [Alphaproteobacteria bacterium]
MSEVVEFFSQPHFWIGLLQIIGIDILLSGDNAVVIALACRSLPAHQRRRGIVLGAAAAIVLRIIFAAFIVHLLAVPYLKIVGGALLFWIAIKLLLPEEGDDQDSGGVDAARNLFQAVKTIVIADAVMSLDNVVGIAAAAKGDVVLVALGLVISIPLIVYGSTLILKLLDRFPIIVAAGGALLGYIAGETMVTDIVLLDWVHENAAWLHYAAPAGGAVFVVAAGMIVARLRRRVLRRIEQRAAEPARSDGR